MATASTSGQSAFGLGRKKKNPGLMDQISKFFGGNKKKRSKGSFRGHLAASPQQSSSRRRTNENAVVHFFRSFSDSLLLDDFEIAQLFMNHSRPRHRVPRAQSHQSEGAETKARCPDSSTCDVLVRDQEKASPVHPLNAGAPSSKLSTEDQTADPTLTRPKEETDTPAADSRPQEMLTN
uniref:Myelin basic protein n=1 Tax=Astatotilapia calliptera TaxID=8154 RepID=A0A3P8NCJ2_ASTCA